MGFGDQFFKISDGETVNTKLISKGFKYPVGITRKKDRLWFSYEFNRGMNEEIKMLQGSRYHGYEPVPIKKWSVSYSQRNCFRLCYLQGGNPYQWFDRPLSDITTTRPTYEHQLDMFRHGYTYHYLVVAAGMGTGKTLFAIELIEASKIRHWYYIAPRSALEAVKLEFERWKCGIKPIFMTYEGLRSLIEKWPAGTKPPNGVIFDESSRLKNPTAKRTQAAQHLADNIRDEYGWDGYVIEMSGTPSPNSPLDWYSQSDITMPGFLKEGDQQKARLRLAIMSEGQSDSGQAFQKLVSWRDNPKKCDVCGKFADDPDHDELNMHETWFHAFKPSVDEVSNLYKRLSGLVVVKLKHQCLSLPEKQYKIIQCQPSQSIINAAKLLVARGESTIKTLTLLRELSDGFQYAQTDIGTEECPLCLGKRTVLDWSYCGPNEEYEKIVEDQFAGRTIPPNYFEKIEKSCTYCSGTGETVKYQREAVQVPCPKEDALNDVIDTHDDVGRLVTYAGFTGSVDRCVQAYVKQQWEVIRVDGRGWWSSMMGCDSQEMLRRFMYKQSDFPRVAFVGQPGAGGMGLTLTASPTIVYYSNDFNAESREQSEDRIHRIGMDQNRGATIIDLFHLPTDVKVLENLRKKKRLQSLSLGDFKAALDNPLTRSA